MGIMWNLKKATKRTVPAILRKIEAIEATARAIASRPDPDRAVEMPGRQDVSAVLFSGIEVVLA